jgi:hypothetical protein
MTNPSVLFSFISAFEHRGANLPRKYSSLRGANGP